MNRRVNPVHALLLFGPIVLAIVFLVLSIELGRARNGDCANQRPFPRSLETRECP